MQETQENCYALLHTSGSVVLSVAIAFFLIIMCFESALRGETNEHLDITFSVGSH